MPNEREAMTLERVRDDMRAELSAKHKLGWVHAVLDAATLQAWFDAIDAHLSSAAEPVAVAYLERLVAGYPTTAFPPSHPNAAGMGKLYTHPSEDARDRHMFIAGWRTASNWMDRDDLIADIGSPAWEADLKSAMAKENGNG